MTPADDRPDAELVRRAAAGERDAFAAIYERHRTVVYRFARLMSGSGAAAIGRILPKVDGRINMIPDPVGHVHYSLDPARKTAMRSPLPVIKRIDGVARTRVAGVAGFEVGGIGTGPIAAQAFIVNGASNDARMESLGTAQIEGIQAQGTRTTVTIAAGVIGNQAPIEMVNEQWYSKELGTIVMSRVTKPLITPPVPPPAPPAP